ncbi:MAG: prenyltransferase/squalene oxidase repeat-containing protein [Scytonema sp. PMC 1069.18]|nr:prenyltransferase/squalene oxidase repeat-containing protein [Scytonema sp. PMC 1069.18]MEC4886070.1 prenyltransferase/squalene oxidase repeat-containing protein [Scytonema sp. PMC 1070.18]
MQLETRVKKPFHSQQQGVFELFGPFFKIAAKDLLKQSKDRFEPKEHLEAAIQWLKYAHDCSPDDGVSWGYSLKGRWRMSYRETSGYIADTFFDLAEYTQDDNAWHRAVSICKWLVEVQNHDGSISNPRYSSEGIVFDTGQVLQGLVRAYEETQDLDFLQAAEAAGDWLVRVADSTGRWTRNTHFGIPHVYNTRVAWLLLKLHSHSPRPEREQIARFNLDWAISQQHNGWFEQCAFTPEEPPFTHNIAYAIRGLLEAGYLLNDQKYIDAATAGARAVLNHVRSDGYIPGQIDALGKARGNYCCLTGNCQMAIIWLKLFQQTREQQYYQSALSSLQYVMSCQDVQTSDPNIRGGIKGSQPIWGKYTRLSYPNWATKFFIDGLLLLLEIEQ